VLVLHHVFGIVVFGIVVFCIVVFCIVTPDGDRPDQPEAAGRLLDQGTRRPGRGTRDRGLVRRGAASGRPGSRTPRGRA